MTSVADLKNGTVKEIITVLIVSGLGFYLAITLSDAVKVTVDRFIPDEDDEDDLKRNWIALAIAIAFVATIVYFIVSFYRSK